MANPGLQGLGVATLSVGAWVAYCRFHGIDPLKLAQQIVANPSDAQNLIASARQAAVSLLPGLSLVGTGDGAAVVAFARKEMGKPYRFGGAGPDSWDCSGLTMKAYATVGVTLPHSALAQSRMGTPVTRKADLQPGDLLFPTGIGTLLGDHVQIFSGNGKCIEAPAEGKNVREVEMWGFKGDQVTARRMVISPVGSADFWNKTQPTEGTSTDKPAASGSAASSQFWNVP